MPGAIYRNSAELLAAIQSGALPAFDTAYWTAQQAHGKHINELGGPLTPQAKQWVLDHPLPEENINVHTLLQHAPELFDRAVWDELYRRLEAATTHNEQSALMRVFHGATYRLARMPATPDYARMKKTLVALSHAPEIITTDIRGIVSQFNHITMDHTDLIDVEFARAAAHFIDRLSPPLRGPQDADLAHDYMDIPTYVFAEIYTHNKEAFYAEDITRPLQRRLVACTDPKEQGYLLYSLRNALLPVATDPQGQPQRIKIEPEIIAMVEALTPETYAWADGLDKLRETLDAITKPGFRQKVGKRDERGWAGPTGAPR